MRFTKIFPLTSPLVAGLLVAGLLSGCDGDRQEPAATDQTAAPTETAATEPAGKALEPFEFLIDWQAAPTYIGVYLAKEQGRFERLGLDVEIVQSWGANAAAVAVAAGKYKFATATGAATVIANSKGAGLVSTAVIYPRLPTVIYGLAEQGVHTPADLSGKTVGVYAQSITKNEFEAFLNIAGVPMEDITMTAISGPDIPLILSGQVDAVLHYFELSPTQLGLQEDVFQLLLREYGVEGYGLNLIAKRAVYEQERDLIEGLTNAVVDAYRSGCADRPAAVRVFLELFPEKEASFVTASWAKVCDFIGAGIGQQTAEGWQTTIDLYNDVGLLDGQVLPADILARQD